MAVFFRWVPREFAPAAVDAGFKSHNGSALWIFDGRRNGYRPAQRILHGAWLIAFDLDQTATTNITTVRHKDFEDDDFGGEAAHPWDVIVKANEPGAYGVGKQRQSKTRSHVKTRFATKREVAKALRVNEKEVPDSYRPGTTWG